MGRCKKNYLDVLRTSSVRALFRPGQVPRGVAPLPFPRISPLFYLFLYVRRDTPSVLSEVPPPLQTHRQFLFILKPSTRSSLVRRPDDQLLRVVGDERGVRSGPDP